MVPRRSRRGTMWLSRRVCRRRSSMTNALDQTTVGHKPAVSLSRSNALLLATDGTSQSDAAILLARVIPFAKGLPVEVLTVVERPAVPWGAIDSSLVGEYERGLRE